jgi:hypothetical protein
VKFVPGRGAAARKFAAWANKVHSGTLSKAITPGRNIQVFSNGEKGVSISTSSPVFQFFKITGTDVALISPRTAEWIPDLFQSSSFMSSDTDAVDQEIYFTMTTGWFPVGFRVCCMNVGSRWECITPGIPYVDGTLTEDATDHTNSFGANITGTDLWEEVTAEVYFPYFLADSGDTFGAVWNTARRRLEAIAKTCPDDPAADSIDGGTASGGGGTEDGGTPGTGSGDLDGGTP